MYLWTNYGESMLYANGETDIITKSYQKFNKVSRPGK